MLLPIVRPTPFAAGPWVSVGAKMRVDATDGSIESPQMQAILGRLAELESTTRVQAAQLKEQAAAQNRTVFNLTAGIDAVNDVVRRAVAVQ